jgi:1-phosphatidylinositol-4-phosphate 5-kinase
VFKAKESAGKSGSFFFFSHDKKFLLKTMNDSEMKVFKEMLPQYLNHLHKNKDSLLARIYGIFTV